MPDTATILSVSGDIGDTFSMTSPPVGAVFDAEYGLLEGTLKAASGNIVLTSTSVDGKVRSLSIPFINHSPPVDVYDPTSEVPYPIPEGSNVPTAYQQDMALFNTTYAALAPVLALSEPTVITVEQSHQIWVLVNIARRNHTDYFFDGLKDFAAAIPNIMFPADVFSFSQKMMISNVLTSLLAVTNKTYMVSMNSELLRRFGNSYLIGYIRRTMSNS